MNQTNSTKSKPSLLKSTVSWLSTMSFLVRVVLGGLFLSLMARAAIDLPFTPIPMTLQTLGVAILAIVLGAREAPLAVFVYLLLATVGLPVLSHGVSNSYWLFGTTAGYLLAFMISSWLVAKLLQEYRQCSFWKCWLILSINEALVLVIGTCWLAYFIGWKSAVVMGMLPFLPGAVIKITLATSFLKSLEWLKTQIGWKN